MPVVILTKIHLAEPWPVSATKATKKTLTKPTAPRSPPMSNRHDPKSESEPRKKTSRAKQVKYKMSDLPAGMHAKFHKVLMPRAKAVAGTKRRPWLSLSVPNI